MIAAQAYPPSLGPGSLRTLGTSTHLSEFGWQPVVITIHERDLGRLADASLRDRIPPSVELIGVPFPERRWSERLRGLMRRGRGRRNRAEPTKDRDERGVTVEPPAVAPAPKRSWLGAVSTFVFGHEVWPASYTSTLRFARRVVSSCDALFSTSPPFQNHLAAQRIHHETRLPWVAEFRDPYACGVWHLRAHKLGRSRAEWREHRVLLEASHVVVVTDAMRDLYLTNILGISPERISVITNGYDDVLRRRADVILASAGARPADQLTILHAGILYAPDALEGLCRAIRLLVDEGKATAADFALELIGAMPGWQGEMTRRFNLESCLRAPGRVSQREAFDRMCNADVLLVEAGDNVAHYAIRAKVFEYMVARRPVLALLTEGPTAEVIRRADMGVCLHPSRTRDIADALLGWLRRKRAGDRLLRMGDPPAEFDRRMLTGRLAALLDRVTARAKMSGGER